MDVIGESVDGEVDSGKMVILVRSKTGFLTEVRWNVERTAEKKGSLVWRISSNSPLLVCLVTVNSLHRPARLGSSASQAAERQRHPRQRSRSQRVAPL